MSETQPSAQNDNFLKAFVPGLVLGLVIGALAGALIPPFLTGSESRPGPVAGGGGETMTDRDIERDDEIDTPRDDVPTDDAATDPDADPAANETPTDGGA